MKHIKTSILLCILLTMILLLTGCKSPFVAYRYPAGQVNSVWETEDGSVMFRIGANEVDLIYGSVETEDGPVEFCVEISPFTDLVGFYYPEVLLEARANGETPEEFAGGYGRIISRKEYQIEITSADVVFTPGEILTFYRVGYSRGLQDTRPSLLPLRKA